MFDLYSFIIKRFITIKFHLTTIFVSSHKLWYAVFFHASKHFLISLLVFIYLFIVQEYISFLNIYKFLTSILLLFPGFIPLCGEKIVGMISIWNLLRLVLWPTYYLCKGLLHVHLRRMYVLLLLNGILFLLGLFLIYSVQVSWFLIDILCRYYIYYQIWGQFSSVQFSCSVVWDSMWPHGL